MAEALAAPDGRRTVSRSGDQAARRELDRRIRSRHPRLREVIPEDARVAAAHRGERSEFRGRLDTALQILRLIWITDAFGAHVLYRVKARLQALGVPLLPRLVHQMAMQTGQVAIGDYTVMAPGVYIVHGQIVIDGITEIGAGVVVSPFVTVGLRAGDFQGPVIEANVNIGTGAKVVGPIRVGAGAMIGANAVVVDDVPPGATVVGAPARPVEGRAAAEASW
jgi:serine O-acetyltransferase